MARLLSFVIISLFVIVCTSTISASWVPRIRPRPRKLSAKEKQERFATKQLQKYGYYTSWVTNKYALREAVSYFQTFNNLPKTGKVDNKVIEKLKQPRCGLRDPVVREQKDFKAQYVQGTHWKNVTWYWDGVKPISGRMSKVNIFKTLRHAFKTWNDVCSGLVIKQKRGREADIDIKFVNKVHRCPFRGDGAGQSVGHAFYPYNNRHMSGDIHFDTAEKFTLSPTNGSTEVHFMWAAMHEIGHSLGLEHSHDPNSIMYPWYNARNPVLKLHENDVIGLKSIYPPTVAKKCRKTKVKATSPSPTTTAQRTKTMTTIKKTNRNPTASTKASRMGVHMDIRNDRKIIRKPDIKTEKPVSSTKQPDIKTDQPDNKPKEVVEWVHFLPVELNDP